MCECAMYISMYTFLIAHDRSMALVSPETEVKRRVKRNAIDLSGHVLNFFMDNAFLVMGAVGFYGLSLDTKWIHRSVLVSRYGIMSALQIGTSSALRNELIEVMQEFCTLWQRRLQRTNRINPNS